METKADAILGFLALWIILTLLVNLWDLVRRKPLTDLSLVKTEDPNERPKFPFNLSDLLYWVVVHEDGTVVKYVFQDAIKGLGLSNIHPSSGVRMKTGPSCVNDRTTSSSTHRSLKEYCAHTPKVGRPIWESPEGEIGLYVADAAGIRHAQEDFDFIIDCGNVLTPWTPNWKSRLTLEGDAGLITGLKDYISDPDKESKNPHHYRLLSIKWFDRAAPPVEPEFFQKLYEMLLNEGGDVVTNCQGGHGRSGTTACALMMMGSPDYTPFDAIVHLRALHCGRAIEGLDQHRYLDEVGKWLNREPNIDKVKEVSSFKEAFEKSTKPTAQRVKEMMAKWDKAIAKPTAMVATKA